MFREQRNLVNVEVESVEEVIKALKTFINEDVDDVRFGIIVTEKTVIVFNQESNT